MFVLDGIFVLDGSMGGGGGGGLNEHGSLNQTVPTVRVQDTEFACSRGAKYHHAKLDDA